VCVTVRGVRGGPSRRALRQMAGRASALQLEAAAKKQCGEQGHKAKRGEGELGNSASTSRYK
jgi:hypothetical protein